MSSRAGIRRIVKAVPAKRAAAGLSGLRLARKQLRMPRLNSWIDSDPVDIRDIRCSRPSGSLIWLLGVWASIVYVSVLATLYRLAWTNRHMMGDTVLSVQYQITVTQYLSGITTASGEERS